MNVLSLCKWDYAGCGFFLSDAINRHTKHVSRSIRMLTSTLQYPYDLLNVSDKLLMELWRWADVIHVHDAPGVPFPPPGLEPKPTVITHHGTIYRRDPQHYNEEARAAGWVATVATPDLTQYGLPWLPDCRPDLSKYIKRSRGSFIVAHAPTKRAVKGTPAVIGAKLAELDLIENVTWEQCLERKGKARLTIDQFKLGYGCNAIEAWSMSQAVIGNGSKTILGQIKSLIGYLPFVACDPTPAAIKATVERLHNDRIEYQEAVNRGRQCYRDFHSPQAVAIQAVAFYEQALAGGPARVPRAHRYQKPQPPEVGENGLTLIEYIGPNAGDMAWYGAITGQQYQLGGVRNRGYVDSRDVPGLLEATDKRGRAVFRVVK